MAIFLAGAGRRGEGRKVTRLSGLNKLCESHRRLARRSSTLGASCNSSGMADAVVLEISCIIPFTAIHELFVLCFKELPLKKKKKEKNWQEADW